MNGDKGSAENKPSRQLTESLVRVLRQVRRDPLLQTVRFAVIDLEIRP